MFERRSNQGYKHAFAGAAKLQTERKSIRFEQSKKCNFIASLLTHFITSSAAVIPELHIKSEIKISINGISVLAKL